LLSFPLFSDEPVFIFDYDQQILIDGLDQDWPAGLMEYPISFVHSGSYCEPLKGPEDFAGSFRMFYSSKAKKLYFFVKVTDDFLNPKVNSNQPGWLWDHLEIFIDGTNSRGSDSDRFTQYTVKPLAGKDVVTNRQEVVPREDLTYDVKYNGKQVTYEVAMTVYERKSLNWKLDLVNGKTIGMDIAFPDNDGDNLGEKGSYISWKEGKTKVLTSSEYAEVILVSSPKEAAEIKQKRDASRGALSLDSIQGLGQAKETSVSPYEIVPDSGSVYEANNAANSTWEQDLEKAINQSNGTDKKVFAYFYTDIERCRSFEKDILSVQEKKILEKFIGVKINILQNQETKSKYGIYRIPSILILSAGGTDKKEIPATNAGIESLF